MFEFTGKKVDGWMSCYQMSPAVGGAKSNRGVTVGPEHCFLGSSDLQKPLEHSRNQTARQAEQMHVAADAEEPRVTGTRP